MSSYWPIFPINVQNFDWNDSHFLTTVIRLFARWMFFTHWSFGLMIKSSIEYSDGIYNKSGSLSNEIASSMSIFFVYFAFTELFITIEGFTVFSSRLKPIYVFWNWFSSESTIDIAIFFYFMFEASRLGFLLRLLFVRFFFNEWIRIFLSSFEICFGSYYTNS